MFGLEHGRAKVMEARHERLRDMAHQVMDKRDVTTINGQVYSVVYMTAASPTNGPNVFQDSQTSTDGSDNNTPTRSMIPPATVSRAIYSSDSSNSASSISYPTAAASSQNYASSSRPAYNTQTAAGSSRTSVAHTGSQASATSTAGSVIQSTDSQSSEAGLSTAGKAGLAVGGILAIGAILGIILFLISKKKKQKKAEEARKDSEKSAAAASAKTTPNAPRLSFRPASSFMPEFMNRPKSRISGHLLGAPGADGSAIKERYLASSTAGQPQSIQMTEKVSPTENPFRDPENPFADPIRSGQQPYPSQSAQYPQGMQAPPQTTPAPLSMPMPMSTPVQRTIAMPEPTTTPASVAMPSPVSSMHSNTTENMFGAAPVPRIQQNPQQMHNEASRRPIEPIEMPTPPMTVPAPLSTPRSAPPPSAENGAPGESKVYRILMDFIPSMEDELELRAGQVVRMLHEYDDGWCLCTRLDRTSQGVVPRTCLAAKPSKPRPGQGPGQGQRPMSPAMGPGPQGRPMSPAMRGPPPQGRPMSPGMGRPMSPGMQRPMSPANQSRRAMSPANQGRRPMSPGPRTPQGQGQTGEPGPYNQSPRPLSPGPRSSKRSQSPGPYGSAGGPAPMAQTRQRSNSSSQTARDVRDRRQSPPGPSPLGGAGVGLGMAM